MVCAFLVVFTYDTCGRLCPPLYCPLSPATGAQTQILLVTSWIRRLRPFIVVRGSILSISLYFSILLIHHWHVITGLSSPRVLTALMRTSDKTVQGTSWPDNSGVR